MNQKLELLKLTNYATYVPTLERECEDHNEWTDEFISAQIRCWCDDLCAELNSMMEFIRNNGINEATRIETNVLIDTDKSLKEIQKYF